jgi:hypothetical protein
MKWLAEFKCIAPRAYFLLQNTALAQSLKKTSSSYVIEKVNIKSSCDWPELIGITIKNNEDWIQSDLKTFMLKNLDNVENAISDLDIEELFALKLIWIELELKCRWHKNREETEALIEMALQDIHKRMGIELPLEIFLPKEG